MFCTLPVTDLLHIARRIPSMGGSELGPLLTMLAEQVAPGRHIVEVGCWLGAGTARLALGARKSGAPITCYDRWRAKASEVEQAATSGTGLAEGQNTLPLVMNTLRPFGARIRYRRGDLRDARWSDGPIGLYVDDASKPAAVWERSVRTFLANVAVGGWAVLMDFHFKPNSGGALPQVGWMTGRSDAWELVEDRPHGTTAAVFRRIA